MGICFEQRLVELRRSVEVAPIVGCSVLPPCCFLSGIDHCLVLISRHLFLMQFLSGISQRDLTSLIDSCLLFFCRGTPLEWVGCHPHPHLTQLSSFSTLAPYLVPHGHLPSRKCFTALVPCGSPAGRTHTEGTPAWTQLHPTPCRAWRQQTALISALLEQCLAHRKHSVSVCY